MHRILKPFGFLIFLLASQAGPAALSHAQTPTPDDIFISTIDNGLFEIPAGPGPAIFLTNLPTEVNRNVCFDPLSNTFLVTSATAGGPVYRVDLTTPTPTITSLGLVGANDEIACDITQQNTPGLSDIIVIRPSEVLRFNGIGFQIGDPLLTRDQVVEGTTVGSVFSIGIDIGGTTVCGAGTIFVGTSRGVIALVPPTFTPVRLTSPPLAQSALAVDGVGSSPFDLASAGGLGSTIQGYIITSCDATGAVNTLTPIATQFFRADDFCFDSVGNIILPDAIVSTVEQIGTGVPNSLGSRLILAPSGIIPFPTGCTIARVPLTIITAIRAIKLGDFFSRQLEVVSGVSPFSWLVVDGTLPPGMTLSPDGVLSGTPSEVGEFNFTVRVTDSTGDFAEKPFTIEVALILLPDIRIDKTGTAAVPGRVLDYFILVQNVGDETVKDIQVFEPLNPQLFSLISVDPPAVADVPTLVDASLILWHIPTLTPGEARVFSYQARLDPLTPLGTEVVGGPACSALELIQIWASCLRESVEAIPACAPCIGVCEVCVPACATPPPIEVGECPVCLAICGTCTLASSCAFEVFEATMTCFDAGKETADCAEKEQEARAPKDPNEKEVIAERFIQPDQLLVYPIHFENIGDIEALDVFVRDVLDPNLDVSTLNILSPNGSFDAATRTVRWDLLGTNLQPGETGNVLFSIKPTAGLPSGTEIRDSAEIQFEVFETITTNEVVNVIDSTPPSCVMDALPSETFTLTFPISWSGSDAIGEIEVFSIFVSVDGGPFTPFLEGTLDTNATFSAEEGERVGFLCVAQDTAGNIEVQDSVAETETLVLMDGERPIILEPFESFDVELEIELDEDDDSSDSSDEDSSDDDSSDDDSDDDHGNAGKREDEFEVEGTFTLGLASDGIDPLTEDVTLKVGTFSTTIPAGSFELDDGGFEFEVEGDDDDFEMEITPLGGGTFGFEAEGEETDLSGTVNPVEVMLTVGNDAGTVNVIAEFDDDDDSDDSSDRKSKDDDSSDDDSESDDSSDDDSSG